MDRRYFRRWAWIVFLLPFLMYGGPNKKNSDGSGPDVQGNLPEENALAFSLDVPLPEWLLTLTENIAFEYGLSPKLVKSIILAESNGEPRKVSPKGAMGLMQLMPVITQEYKILDPLDPVANIRGGVRYLRNLLEEFSGDLYLALAAYNAGPGTVRKYQGIPPFRETQEFVRKVSEIFHSGEETPHLLPTTLRINRGEPSDRAPAPVTISGSPRSLGIFLRKMGMEAREVRDQ